MQLCWVSVNQIIYEIIRLIIFCKYAAIEKILFQFMFTSVMIDRFYNLQMLSDVMCNNSLRSMVLFGFIIQYPEYARVLIL